MSQLAEVLEIEPIIHNESRTPERQVLFAAINSLKAADADLDATRRAVSDHFNARMARQHEVDELRAATTSTGAIAMLERVTRAVESGVEPSLKFFNDDEAQLGTRLKSLLQDIELYTRREAASAATIPEMGKAVGTARHKVKEAALAVIRASDAVVMITNDLEVLQNEIITKRVALRFFISRDLVPPDDAGEVKRLMKTDLPPHPMDTSFVNWSAHTAYLKWADALERLMTDADAELPTELPE